MATTEAKDFYDIAALRLVFDRLGYHFEYMAETPTTMDLAKAHAEAGKKLPAVFLTDHQTQGIGRDNRVWLDKLGASILVSGIFEIKENTTAVFADLVTLHTCRMLTSVTGIDALRIKYPNDLVIHNRKAAGLLALNVYDGRTYLGTNVGIGINVHYNEQGLIEYSTDYGTTALDLHTNKPNSRQKLLVAIFGGLKFLPVDAEVFQSNLQRRDDQNNLWRDFSSVLERGIEIEDGTEIIGGRVVDTQIGKGIFLQTVRGSRWFNQFDSSMKVRVLD